MEKNTRTYKTFLAALDRRMVTRAKYSHKWTKTRKDLKPGDVVLVINLNLPRGHWPLGRIIEVFPGKDGHVRIPKVLLGKNVLVRPISKLCSL